MRPIEKIPVIFEEARMSLKKDSCEVIGGHLFVFVHGFQGTSADMQIFKTIFTIHNPNWHFLCSKSNEGVTDGDISLMGKRLADEIKDYIKIWFPNPKLLGKLSFLGHSLGGVVIRAALPLLEEYKEKMWSLITFASPHLGYMFSESKLINAGLWVLKKLYGSQSLEQLSLSDKSNIHDCFIYRLAMAKVISPINVGIGMVQERDTGEFKPGLVLAV